ncbi:hypothetical protein RIF29_29092 [Crotalaria pallida]|uniref:Uncharacterized protein n=1 Tax=Crotalaria pallida TaxID=3830 RepID=A0AAN9EJ41_CROPI
MPRHLTSFTETFFTTNTLWKISFFFLPLLSSPSYLPNWDYYSKISFPSKFSIFENNNVTPSIYTVQKYYKI